MTTTTEKKMRRWPTKMETSKDLAGFLRRKLEVTGRTAFMFGTAERLLRDVLAEWKDAYEIAVMLDRIVDARGATAEIWNLLDLRSWLRLNTEYAPVKGTALYYYLAKFSETSDDNRAAIYDILIDLEDALVAEVQVPAEVRRLKADLDGRVLGLLGREMKKESDDDDD